MEAIDEKRILMAPVDLISENPFQPRKTFDEADLNELAESIKTHGLIQPIILRKVGERYQVVAGERRLRACKSIGMAVIPSILIEIDGVDVAEISLVENIQRRNLNCLEEAEAFHIMKTRFGMTAEEIAQKIGKSRSYVANTLRLNALSDSIKKELVTGAISMGHGRALLAVDDKRDQEAALSTIIKNSLSVRQTEDLITSISDKKNASGKARKKKHDDDGSLDELLQEYYTSLKGLIRNIKQIGGKVEVVEKETDKYFEYTIRIPK